MARHGEERLNLGQLAADLGVSRPTARKLLRTGAVPGLWTGGRWVVARSTIDRLLGGDPVAPDASQPADATALPTIGR